MVSDKVEQFREKYPSITQFFLSRIYDFPEYSYEKIVKEYCEVKKAQEFTEVVQEIKAILLLKSFPWYEIRKTANRYFKTPEETKEWLKYILSLLEKYKYLVKK